MQSIRLIIRHHKVSVQTRYDNVRELLHLADARRLCVDETGGDELRTVSEQLQEPTDLRLVVGELTVAVDETDSVQSVHLYAVPWSLFFNFLNLDLPLPPPPLIPTPIDALCYKTNSVQFCNIPCVD